MTARRSERVTFEGGLGAMLAGRLELPEGEPRAYALFAHCFTCSKDSVAAARISRRLCDHGIAVLRFDFTGLGDSGGDFASTSFSSNVQDLLKAAEFLRTAYQAPELLVGHSLGGTAVLAAAGDIPEARAVATIGAPADAAHVAGNFGADVTRIEAEGEAEVELGGRRFRIRKQFLDDIRSQPMGRHIAELRRPLLIFHAPRDEIVGIDNAEKIFLAARHPKSFISLDDADHLLTRRADAAWVADVLAAWASRYLGEMRAETEAADAPPVRPLVAPEPDRVVVVETGAGKFQNQVIARRHVLLADEPREVGGTDTGPTPYDFLNAALGACTSMTLRLYADRKGIAARRFIVRVGHERIHASDCAECALDEAGAANGRTMIDVMNREITIEGAVSEADKAKLLEIADKCPVHRTLENRIVVRTRLAPAPIAPAPIAPTQIAPARIAPDGGQSGS